MGKLFDYHLKDVRQIFSRKLLKLNLQKCSLFQQEGYFFPKSGINIDAAKMKLSKTDLDLGTKTLTETFSNCALTTGNSSKILAK